MSFTSRAHKLKQSGVCDALGGATARKRVLVLGGTPLADTFDGSLSSAWINRARPSGGFRGCSSSAIVSAGITPFTRADGAPTNLTKGAVLQAWSLDQPNAPGETYGKWFDTSAAAGDGTAGLESITLNGGHEYIWAAGADVTADSLICSTTLNTHTQAKTANWWEAELKVTAFVLVPAADATGANPIVGGPSLKLGLKRGAASWTLGSASTATTTAQVVTLTGTLAAGVGLPAAGLFSGDATTNRGRRCVPIMFVFEDNTATTGTVFVFVANPELPSNGWSGAGSQAAWDPLVLKAIKTALGGFDAMVVHCGHHLYFDEDLTGFAAELQELINGVPNDCPESHSDWLNTLASTAEIGEPPKLLVGTWYYGRGDDQAESETIYSSFNESMRQVCDLLDPDGTNGNHAAERWGRIHTGAVNLYHGIGTRALVEAAGDGGLVIDKDTDFRPTAAGSQAFVDAVWDAIDAANANHASMVATSLGQRTARAGRAQRLQR